MEEIIQKIGIIYCRVSSKEQIENTSLDMQEKYCLDYAQKNNTKILKIFREEGESAKTANRTKFIEALKYCNNKQHQINYFIVFKIDRFARNQDDHVAVRAVLRKLNIELKSVTEPIDNTPIGRAMEGMLSVFSELDNNIRIERTKNGMIERVRQGAWCWPTPIGYKKIPGDSNIYLDREKSSLIKFAFEEYAKSIYTYKSLAELLNKKGLTTSKGGKINKQLVEKFLKNPIYTGIIRAFGEENKGNFEPIISKELFCICQKGKQAYSGHSGLRKANNDLFPLRGIIKCTECSGTLTGSTSTGRGGKKYTYYHHHRQGCPKAKSISKQILEQQFVDRLKEITPDIKYEKMFKAIVTEVWKNSYKKLNQENDKINLEIKHLANERNKIFDFHRDGKYTDEEFQEQKQRINQLITTKRYSIRNNWHEEFNIEETLNYCFNFISNTTKTWLHSDYQTKLQFQKLIFDEKIEYDGQKFGNAGLSSIYKLNQDYGDKKSNLVTPQGIEP